ncbi:MAG: YfhO family protein [Acidobacteria bacterium]|nr:YfhO family protein [Acidobacteriota bacterium]
MAQTLPDSQQLNLPDSNSRPEIISRAVAAAGLLLLPVLFFYPTLTRGLLLAPGDGWTANLGLRILLGQMIGEGNLPLWNPYIFAGMPFLATVYPGVLYLPNWIFAVLSPLAAMNTVVITTFHLAAIGAYLYARVIGCRREAALVSGIAFGLGGYLVAHLGQTSHIAAAAWLPWVVLAVEKLYQRLTWRWVTIGSIIIAVQLFAGVPQMNFYTAQVWAGYVLFAAFVRAEKDRRRQFLTRSGAMAVCGLLLSCVQLFSLRELLPNSARGGIDYDFFASFSLPPGQSLNLIFPYFFGGALKLPYKMHYWGVEGTAEMFGYAGLLTLLFAAIAVFKMRGDKLIRFWALAAVLALLLAFGGFLPFGIHKLIFQIPVFNLFRVAARNLLIVNLALAVLAGLGVNKLSELSAAESMKLWRKGAAALAIVVGVTLIAYRWFGARLSSKTPPPDANLLTNAEAVIPLSLFVVVVAISWFYARRQSASAGLLLVAVLAIDLASFGQFYEWKIFKPVLAEHLIDPPAVKLIKSRESDFNSFRVATESQWGFGENFSQLNQPNLSIARGLQSINGYDMLRLDRMSAVAGGMSPEGWIADSRSFDLPHQGFNLLNVKYVLRERAVDPEDWYIIEHNGVQFLNAPIDLELKAGKQAHTQIAAGATASSLFLITTMTGSAHVPDGQVVARIKLHTADGRVFEREIQAGRDTAEWAYDRPDVAAAIKHRRPAVAESWPGDGFQAHRYLSRFDFDRSEIEQIEFNYEPTDETSLIVVRASLLDGQTEESAAIDGVSFLPERWRKLGQFDKVEVYENLKAMPRAWFVKRLEVELSKDVLETIKTGKLTDGREFNPAEMALLEKEDFGNRPVTLPEIGDSANSEVKVTKYEPNCIELATRNAQPGFLVLSEIYYRGWEAWMDGRRVPVEKVNYTLRGLAVPAGDHRIEFVFRAHSFRNGAAWSALGIVLLIVGGIFSSRRRKVDAVPRA